MIVIAAIAAAGAAIASPPDAPAAPPAASPPAAAAALLDPGDVEPATAPPTAPLPPPVDPEPAIRDAFTIAQSLQGPLDGGWRLNDTSGRPLLIFQLSDPGGAASDAQPAIEGAWRDPSRAGATDSSGFLAEVERQGDGLSIRFYERDGGSPVIVNLHTADGEWRGELFEQGARRRVVMDPL